MFVLRLKRRHRNGSNECFDKGLGLVSPLQHEMLADVAVGSKADKPSRAKIHRCPLLSESDHPGVDERCQHIASHYRDYITRDKSGHRAPALGALDMQHVELANQVAEYDRAVARHYTRSTVKKTTPRAGRRRRTRTLAPAARSIRASLRAAALVMPHPVARRRLPEQGI
jgi:hypothetical protein